MKAVWNGHDKTLELVPENEADQSELVFMIQLSRIVFNKQTVERDTASGKDELKKVVFWRRD